MKRVPEPELMLAEEQARAYAAADFQEPHDRFVALLQEKFPELPPSGHALDLGCGPGDISRRFARAYAAWAVDGIDGSPAMLKIGQRQIIQAGLSARIRLHQRVLPTDWAPQRTASLIFSNSLLHHLHDPLVLWNSIQQWGEKGANVLVMDLMRPPSREEATALVDQYAAGEPEVLRTDFFNSLLAAYRPDEIRTQLRCAGLDHLQLEVVSDRHFIVWGSMDSKPQRAFAESFPQWIDVPTLGKVHRLGLATRGNTELDADAVLSAIERGVSYLNWCGHDDGMSEAIRQLGSRRAKVQIAVQFSARTADAARRELETTMKALDTEVIDVASYYYVEHQHEWDQIVGPDGAAGVLEAAKQRGHLRSIGLTSHQRQLAAACATTGRLDLLMVRYNAAHRGAERDVFPTTGELGMPVVVFTCTRWGELLKSTPSDPPEFQQPPAADWYRFAMMHPAVSVALMAPNGREELEENLKLLDNWRGLSPAAYQPLAEHGARVRNFSSYFP